MLSTDKVIACNDCIKDNLCINKGVDTINFLTDDFLDKINKFSKFGKFGDEYIRKIKFLRLKNNDGGYIYLIKSSNIDKYL